MSGPSNRHIKYECTACKKDVGRANLFVKRVVFATMGEHYRSLKSRTVAWLCYDCREIDPAWNQEKLAASPGMADVKGVSNGRLNSGIVPHV